MKYIYLYLFIINASSFALMLMDKRKAKRNRLRIPERTLLGAAILGGSVGTLVAMYTFNHKVRRLKFTVGVPAILIAQLALAWYVL